MSGGSAEAPGRPVVALGDESVPVGRIFCIGRNYAEHVREMGAEPPSSPVMFLKPAESLLEVGRPIPFPRHGRDLEHEVELVLLLGNRGAGWERVEGVGLGLDLTLRDIQARAKRAGLPWETAKAFEASAPVGPLQPPSGRRRFRFECRVNGELRQRADTDRMLFGVPELIAALGRVWRLRRGDLLFTGTPEGVGPLVPGDRVTVASEQLGACSWSVEPPETTDS